MVRWNVIGADRLFRGALLQKRLGRVRCIHPSVIVRKNSVGCFQSTL